MDSSDLEKHQAKKLHEQIRPTLAFLKKLRERMTHQNFPTDDKLFVAAKKAEEAVHHLLVTTHYLSCGQGFKSSQNELIAHEDAATLLNR